MHSEGGRAGWLFAGLAGLFLLAGGAAMGMAEHQARRGSGEQHIRPLSAGPDIQVRLLPASTRMVRQAVWAMVAEDDGTTDPNADLDSWTDEIAAQVWVPAAPTRVMVLPAANRRDLAWALPGAYWAVHDGFPIVFIGARNLDPESRDLLRRFGVPAVVAAPPHLIPEALMRQIQACVPAERIAGDDLCSHTAAIANHRMPPPGGLLLAAITDADQALAALPLARVQAPVLLYLTDEGRLPIAFHAHPREPHVWLAGTQAITATADGIRAVFYQRWVAAGKKLKAVSVGVLGLVLGLAVVGATVCFFRRKPQPLALRVGWSLTAIFAPVVSLGFRAQRPKGRSPVAMYGYVACLLMAAAFGLTTQRFPAAWGGWVQGWGFFIATGLLLMAAAIWVSVLFLAWLEWMPSMVERRARRMLTRSVSALMLASLGSGLGLASLGAILAWLQPPVWLADQPFLRAGLLWLAGCLGLLLAGGLEQIMAGPATGTRHESEIARPEEPWPKPQTSAIRD